jgi:hypothetical protein
VQVGAGGAWILGVHRGRGRLRRARPAAPAHGALARARAGRSVIVDSSCNARTGTRRRI